MYGRGAEGGSDRPTCSTSIRTSVQRTPQQLKVRLSPGACSWGSPLTLFGKAISSTEGGAAAEMPPSQAHRRPDVRSLGSMERSSPVAWCANVGRTPRTVKRGAPDPRSRPAALASHHTDQPSRASWRCRRHEHQDDRDGRCIKAHAGADTTHTLSSESSHRAPSPSFAKGYPYLTVRTYC